jgi:hypothetical protein
MSCHLAVSLQVTVELLKRAIEGLDESERNEEGQGFQGGPYAKAALTRTNFVLSHLHPQLHAAFAFLFPTR